MSDERAGSILTRSVGGTVSVIRDLTLDECRAIYDRLDPWHGHYYDQPKQQDGSGLRTWGMAGVTSMRRVEDGDIEVREVFGPPEWDRGEMNTWGHWPKERESGPTPQARRET